MTAAFPNARGFDVPRVFDREGRANGVYNTLFQYHAAQVNRQYLICPEVRAHLQGGNATPKADLVLYSFLIINAQTQTVDPRPVLTFEGKRQTGDQFPAIREQIERWCDEYVAEGVGQNTTVIEQGKPCWAVGARGDKVLFWLYTATVPQGVNHDQRMCPVRAYPDQNNIPMLVVEDPANHDAYANNAYFWDSNEATAIFQRILADPYAVNTALNQHQNMWTPPGQQPNQREY